MKVLFVNRSYWPDAEATGQLLTELCEDLGGVEPLEVSVICGQPNFNLENLEYSESGVEVRNGVTIHRVRHTRFDKSTFWGRVTNFITFLIAATWKTLWVSKPDLIVVETDPPLLCLLGGFVSKIRGVKLVCYLQDVYPDIAIKLGRLKINWFTKLLRWSFLNVYRASDRMIVVGHDMKRWLVNHLVDEDKICTIENWVDTERVYPVKVNNPFRLKNRLRNKTVAMYSGNLGYTQRFDLVLDAAEKLQHIEDLVFVFVGNGVRRRMLTEEVINRGLPNVRFVDYQPKSQLADSLSAADIHFVLLDSNLTGLMMPSKIYGALASGTAVVGIGAPTAKSGDETLNSHLAQIIESNDAGFFVDEASPHHLVDAIEQLCEHPEARERMGANARQIALKLHSKRLTVKKFVSLFSELGRIPIDQFKIPQPAEVKQPVPLVPAAIPQAHSPLNAEV